MVLTTVERLNTFELVVQEHKQKLYKACSRCKKDTWHVESKHILQPPKYLIIIVNRFNCMNNSFTKNRNLILLDLNIMLSPYKFDTHGHSMNCSHYTASISYCDKTFYSNLELLNTISTIHITHRLHILLYKLITEVSMTWPSGHRHLRDQFVTAEGGGWSTPMVSVH